MSDEAQKTQGELLREYMEAANLDAAQLAETIVQVAAQKRKLAKVDEEQVNRWLRNEEPILSHLTAEGQWRGYNLEYVYEALRLKEEKQKPLSDARDALLNDLNNLPEIPDMPEEPKASPPAPPAAATAEPAAPLPAPAAEEPALAARETAAAELAQRDAARVAANRATNHAASAQATEPAGDVEPAPPAPTAPASETQGQMLDRIMRATPATDEEKSRRTEEQSHVDHIFPSDLARRLQAEGVQDADASRVMRWLKDEQPILYSRLPDGGVGEKQPIRPLKAALKLDGDKGGRNDQLMYDLNQARIALAAKLSAEQMSAAVDGEVTPAPAEKPGGEVLERLRAARAQRAAAAKAAAGNGQPAPAAQMPQPEPLRDGRDQAIILREALQAISVKAAEKEARSKRLQDHKGLMPKEASARAGLDEERAKIAADWFNGAAPIPQEQFGDPGSDLNKLLVVLGFDEARKAELQNAALVSLVEQTQRRQQATEKERIKQLDANTETARRAIGPALNALLKATPATAAEKATRPSALPEIVRSADYLRADELAARIAGSGDEAPASLNAERLKKVGNSTDVLTPGEAEVIIGVVEQDGNKKEVQAFRSAAVKYAELAGATVTALPVQKAASAKAAGGVSQGELLKGAFQQVQPTADELAARPTALKDRAGITNAEAAARAEIGEVTTITGWVSNAKPIPDAQFANPASDIRSLQTALEWDEGFMQRLQAASQALAVEIAVRPKPHHVRRR